MSRGFFGARSGSSNSSKKKKSHAKQRFMDKKQGKASDDQMSKEEIYQQRLDERMTELKKKALEGKEDGRELSKGTLAALQMLAEKQERAAAKRRAKRKKLAGIKPAYIMGPYGGRIDKNGNIYGPDNKVVGRIDPKSGKIRNNMGMCIGKYGGPTSETIIARHIEKVYKAQKAGGSIWGSADAASIWGTPPDNSGSGW